MASSVAELCVEKNVSFEELTEKSGLDSMRVTAIIFGRWTPSPAERQSISKVFDLTPADISWGHQTPIQHIYGHGPS